MTPTRRSRFSVVAFGFSLIAVAVLLVAQPAAAQRRGNRQQQQQQGQPQILQQLQKGIELLQQSHTEEGLAEIEKVIEAEPRLAMAYYYAGQASAQLKRWQQAYDYFIAATEQAPGYGQAHMQACRVAYTLGNLDDAYEQAVLASQAGVDMTDAFAGLQSVMELPADWRQRLEVPRVLIGNIDTQALLQQGSSAFGGRQADQTATGADSRGTPPTDPVSGLPAGLMPPTSPGALPIGVSGSGLAAQLQAEIHEVRRRFGEELQRSAMFGVVMDRELATYVLFLKVDDIGEDMPTPLMGFVKLLDPASGVEIYSRPLQLSNITSVSDLRNDVARYVGYMEEWLREQRR